MSRTAEYIAEIVAQRCSSGTKKDGSPRAPQRHAIIWQAARLGALEHARYVSDDVVRLVIAARVVAFERQDADALRELDQASEAFASRVPWDGEPTDER